MALTIGGLLLDARAILNDVVPTSGGTRYSDADLIGAFNIAALQARAKRPDLFLSLGMRTPVPQFQMPANVATPFPFDQSVYPAFLYYVVGHSEMREDTFSDDSRATTLMNKFVSQLLAVAS